MLIWSAFNETGDILLFLWYKETIAKRKTRLMLMYVGGVVLLRNFPFVGEVRLTVLTRFRERAIRSYRTIDRVGPSKRDFTSQSEIIVW